MHRMVCCLRDPEVRQTEVKRNGRQGKAAVPVVVAAQAPGCGARPGAAPPPAHAHGLHTHPPIQKTRVIHLRSPSPRHDMLYMV